MNLRAPWLPQPQWPQNSLISHWRLGSKQECFSEQDGSPIALYVRDLELTESLPLCPVIQSPQTHSQSGQNIEELEEGFL